MGCKIVVTDNEIMAAFGAHGNLDIDPVAGCNEIARRRKAGGRGIYAA